MRAPGSRIPGRGRLLASTRELMGRVRKFIEHRATSEAERVWGARYYDGLEATYLEGLAAPGARAGLEAVDRRRAVSRKTPPAPVANGSPALEGLQ